MNKTTATHPINYMANKNCMTGRNPMAYMTHMTLSLFKLCLLTVCLLTTSSLSQAATLSLTDFKGQAIELNDDKILHLVFTDIWSIYGNERNDPAFVAALPTAYLNQSQQIWVQPGMNITVAQMHEFLKYYPSVSPLVLDKGFQLMRNEQVWSSPFHVLYKDNQRIFAGHSKALLKHLGIKDDSAREITNHQPLVEDQNQESIKSSNTNLPVTASKKTPIKSLDKVTMGDRAPAFTATSLTGEELALSALTKKKPLSLVFLDSLCPMPQFPGCEAKLQQLQNLIKEDNSRQWLGVVNSYYVTEAVAQEFASAFKLTLPLVFDHNNHIFKAYQVHATPYQVDIAKGGQLVYRGDTIH